MLADNNKLIHGNVVASIQRPVSTEKGRVARLIRVIKNFFRQLGVASLKMDSPNSQDHVGTFTVNI